MDPVDIPSLRPSDSGLVTNDASTNMLSSRIVESLPARRPRGRPCTRGRPRVDACSDNSNNSQRRRCGVVSSLVSPYSVAESSFAQSTINDPRSTSVSTSLPTVISSIGLSGTNNSFAMNRATPRVFSRSCRTITYWDCGDPIYTCIHCRAMLWYEERTIKTYCPSNPKFSICCSEGKVQLPLLLDAPQPLLGLMEYRGGRRSRVFRSHIKVINSMFAFTSTGGNLDNSVNDGRSPYTYRLNGHNHHRIGTLLPTMDDMRPRYAQLYIYDTENEVENRFFALGFKPTNSDDNIVRSIVQELIVMLNEKNPLVQAFRMAKDRFNDSSMHPVRLRLIGTRNRDGRQYNLPTVSEVAALVPGDGSPNDNRDVLIEERGTRTVQRISEIHPLFMALQYPLLFPYGEDGYNVNIRLSANSSMQRSNVSMREFYCYRLFFRMTEGHTLLKGGRMFHTYIVDAYAAVLDHDLEWYKRNQNTIRSDLYRGLYESVCAGDTDGQNVGRRTILPSSFTGGPRHMIQQYQDAMAVCRWAGPPDLFITMTCNPKWPEIARHVQQTIPGQPIDDRPDLYARIFKIKLDELMRDLRKKHFFGRAKAVIYTIEFQKRGLPHCHCLLFLEKEDSISTAEDIDKFISAELPSQEDNPVLYEAVRTNMMHGPCGHLNPSCLCMLGGRCRFNYPKEYSDQTTIKRDGWPSYRRRNNGSGVRVGRQDIMLDNRHVVPYNPDLLVKYGCHINVEWCNQGSLVKYLFSYLNKGVDRATVVLEGRHSEVGTSQGNNVQGRNQRQSFLSILSRDNEIEEFLNCRYISAIESCWKLFGMEMHYRSIAVERLTFHEEECHRVYFRDYEDVQDVLDRPFSMITKFTAWMEANRLYPEARLLTYCDFPTRFTWHDREKVWKPRKNGMAIGRIYYVNPTEGEKYYLRMLLNVVRGPISFKDIRTVDGIEHPSYRSACKALNLLGDDIEWVESIREASQWKMGNRLRELFVSILLFCTVSDHAKLFWDCFPYLSEDVVYNQRRILNNENVLFSESEIVNYTLVYLERILNGCNRSLSDFPELPQLDQRVQGIGSNRLIAAERTFDVEEEKTRFDGLYSGLNVQQKDVFNCIINAIQEGNGGFFFVSGCGGTGKTYLWRTLISAIRSKGQIVLSVASSGIASMLLPGGCTSHSRFRIPLDLDKDSCCSIDVGSDLAELIKVAELIIWDEAPLQHRYAFEAVDRTLRDVLRYYVPGSENRVFGGKVVVLGGDFRQVLPVITHGKRCDVVDAVINKSVRLWRECHVFVLTANMRLRDPSIDGNQRIEIEEFNKWLLDIGAGRVRTFSVEGEDDDTWISLPDDLLLPTSNDPIEAVTSHIYAEIETRITDLSYLEERCILSPTNDVVDKINLHLLSKMAGEMNELLSSDEICASMDRLEELQLMYPREFLNSLRFSGVPNHILHLKVGAPILLLRNLNLQAGLCNGTRLLVTQISRRVLEAVIITGSHVGDKVLIGRIDMTPTDSSWPFKFKRRQFPVKVCFAMTINKSQGQTFNHVCAYLEKPVFSHGHLYVAASRVTSRAGLRFYIDNNNKFPNNITKNVVYKEVFYNLPFPDNE